MRKPISVTEAARNFAECVNRAHYQNVSYILMKNGSPVARLGPNDEKVCTGQDLATAIADAMLSPEAAKTWNHDLQSARNQLKPLPDKWR
jgi:antitoxin (DNA-binding transcriptional repressor) of toxin-antitoxin stability system